MQNILSIYLVSMFKTGVAQGLQAIWKLPATGPIF